MPSIYDFEIQSYRSQVKSLQSELVDIDWGSIENLTHFSLARSNRINFLAVGLCGLVEVKLFEIAEAQENFNIERIKYEGLKGLKKYLKELSAINFGDLKHWDAFNSIYEIRNTIVHSYGGMIAKQDPTRIKTHLSKLDLENILVGDRRVRLTTEALDQIILVVDNLIGELNYLTR